MSGIRFVIDDEDLSLWFSHFLSNYYFEAEICFASCQDARALLELDVRHAPRQIRPIFESFRHFLRICCQKPKDLI